MTPSDIPPLAPGASSSQAAFATATQAIRSVPVSRAGIIRYCIGFALLGLLWLGGLMLVAAVILPQRLTDANVPNPAAVLGGVNAFGTVFALVSNIVWGVFSDRTRSSLGRRTPWIIVGTLLAGFFLWSTGATSEPALIIAAFCGFQVCLNMLLAPATAVLADRVPESARGVVSACYGTGLTVGTQVGILVGAAFIQNLAVGFVLGGVIVAVSGVLAVIVWPKERSTKNLPPATKDLRGVLRSLRPPRNAPDFYWAFGSRFFMLVSYQMITAYQLYIVQNYVGQTVEESAATLATMALITLVVSLVGSAVSGPVSDLLKRRRMPVIVAALLFAVGIAMPWIWPTTLGMFLFAGIAGLGYGVYISVDQALLVDVLPNADDAGKDLSILNMSTTAGATLGPLVTSAIVTISGAYLAVFPIAIVFALLGAFSIVRIKHVR